MAYIRMSKRGTPSGMNEAGGGGGGGNNRNFLNAKPIKGLLGGIKGTSDPLKYAKELLTAIKDGKSEEFKDLHARFPVVMTKLNSQANSQVKSRLGHLLDLGHEALLDLRKVYLAERNGEMYPPNAAAALAMRDSYDQRFRAIWKVLEDRALSDLVDAAGTAVSMQVDKAYMNLVRQKGQQKTAQLAKTIQETAVARVLAQHAPAPAPLPVIPIHALGPTGGAPPPGTGGGGGGGAPLPVPLYPPPPRQTPALVSQQAPVAPYVPPAVGMGSPGSAFPPLPRPPTGGYKRKGRKGSRTRRNKRSYRAKTRRS